MLVVDGEFARALGFVRGRFVLHAFYSSRAMPVLEMIDLSFLLSIECVFEFLVWIILNDFV